MRFEIQRALIWNDNMILWRNTVKHFYSYLIVVILAEKAKSAKI